MFGKQCVHTRVCTIQHGAFEEILSVLAFSRTNASTLFALVASVARCIEHVTFEKS